MIRYVMGDATLLASRPGVIVHVVNDIGAWGAGFSGALSVRYPKAEQSYLDWRAWSARGSSLRFGLGYALLAAVEPYGAPPGLVSGVHVAHLCAQHGLRSRDNPTPLDYTALDRSLGALAWNLRWLVEHKHWPRVYPLTMPRIGCGLAGGTWGQVGPLVDKHLGEFDVTVCDL